MSNKDSSTENSLDAQAIPVLSSTAAAGGGSKYGAPLGAGSGAPDSANQTAADNKASAGSGATPGDSTGYGGNDGGNSNTAAVKVPRWPGLLALLCFVLLLAVVAAVAYLGWQQLQQQQQWQAEQQKLRQQQSLLDNQQQSLSQQLQQAENQLLQRWQQEQRAAEKRLVQLEQDLQSTQQRVFNLTTTDRSDWLLAEAEFLIRLANQRLFVSSDVSSARKMLQNADRIIRDLNDMSLLRVRRAIAHDLAALAPYSDLDPMGQYLALETIGQQLAQLKPYQPKDFQRSHVAADADSSTTGIQANLQGALAKLGGYINYQRRETPVEPLPDQRELNILRRNQQLLIQQAQAALLQGEQQVYQHSLAKLQSDVSRYYQHNSQSQLVLQLIERHAGYQVAPVLPDISKSQQLLQQILDERHYRPAVREKTEQPSAVEPSVVKPEEQQLPDIQEPTAVQGEA